MAEKKYRVEFNYSMYKCNHAEGADHSTDTLMHGVEGGVFDDLEYEDLVKLEAAFMGALGGMGLEEVDKKKKGKK